MPSKIRGGTADLALADGRILRPSALVGANAAAPPFAPTDIAGLKVWLKADALVLSNNDPVGTWADSSGNGYDVTQGAAGAKPTYKTNIQNGLAVVDFDGGDQLTNTATSLVSANSAHTVFAVGKSDTADGGAVFVLRLSANFSASYLLSVFGIEFVQSDEVASNVTVTEALTFKTSPFLGVWRNAGGATTPEFYANGVAFTVSGNQVTESGTTGFSIGSPGFNTWDGWIAELLVYDTALSTLNRQAVQTYLNTKYVLY